MRDKQLKHIECVRKPIKCPTCGKRLVATILYGMPNMMPELEQAINEGRTTIGGCCERIDDPIWECSHCGQKIHKK